MASVFPDPSLSVPNADTESIGEMGDSTRDHLTRMRAALASGTMVGFDGTPSGGTPDQPAVITYSRGAERIRETITWGTVAGAAGNPEIIDYAYSDDSGATWDAIGTLTHTFDAAGNVTAWAWS